MRPIEPLHRQLLILFMGWCLVAATTTRGESQTQQTQQRQWCNLEGKNLLAELLDFGPEIESGRVRMRAKGGAVFEVDPFSLCREDRAIILQKLLERRFRNRSPSSAQSFAFSPNRMPQSQAPSLSASVENTRDRCWMSLKATVKDDSLRQGRQLILAARDEILQIPYREEDIVTRRAETSVEVTVSDHEKLKSLLESSELKAYIDKGNRDYSPLPLQVAVLREVRFAYDLMSGLMDGYLWWSVWNHLSADEVARLNSDPSTPSPHPDSDKGAKSLLTPLRDWLVAAQASSFKGAVAGFSKDKFVFQLEDDSSRAMSLWDLDTVHHLQLAELRTVASLYETWHPYDEAYHWHWPKVWADPDQRIARQVLLFGRNRKTELPVIFFQQHFPNREGVLISEGNLVSENALLNLEFKAADGMILRTRSGTTAWHPITGDRLRILLVAVPAIDGLKSIIETGSAGAEATEFSSEELKASLEAVEIYRIWEQFNKPQG